ncbi:Disease resistance protein (TIR-NBS-LRR class) family [Raphanus sativus]|nr:Disease resistance protein (TIR-NBS-LRR class) family [Raphanus sativus]
MASSFFLPTVAAAAAAFSFFTLFGKFRFHKKIDPSSLSPTSTPTTLSHNCTHHVFPSFRGEDVRRDFFSHIRKEFQRKGITPFNDNKIKRGESIGPELIGAIRGSKIAVVLISRNYASSKWCLDELVEIMKCREELSQTVMAIFYKVDPSDVKKLTGDFGKVFRKTCAGKSKEDTERWRQALAKVATVAGYHSSNWDNEAAMIEKIATDVSNELINSTVSSDFDSLVGMRTHIENVEPLLHLASDEVKMVGIWGPSGIGKSTIARVLFSKYSHQFQLSVFMENIRVRYPRPCYDEYSAKLQLQKEFLSQIINQEDIKLHHLGVAQDRLKDKRVLVVLDDVDQLVQLDAMAKETTWFGPGSRIIITTQDKKILNAHKISQIYQVDFPPGDEALQIFCTYAFGQKSPNESFEELAWEVIELSGKLPLGLRVMGSYFKGMSKEEWTKAVPRLKISLDGDIESILKFSYDALCYEDKNLFLHIACFFNNEWVEKVEEHLAESFFDVRQGLHVLAEKSLISGVRSVVGIDFKYSEITDELYRSDKAFESMSSLQFLRLDGNYIQPISYLSQSVNYLPRKVRLLHWEHFPMKCLPSNFSPQFLVELNMPDSELEKLWEGTHTIRNLKWMDLSFSINLKELPDLSTATSLKKLKIPGCSSLLELPSSIGNATNLEGLDLNGCSDLVELPSSIGNAMNLKDLDLTSCTTLLNLPSSMGRVTALEKLNLNGCKHLLELPSSIGNATNLRKLDLENCSSLVELPFSIRDAVNLKHFIFSGCSSLVELPAFCGNATDIKEFNLRGCSSLVKLPSSIGNITSLKNLDLSECFSLVELPSSIGNITDLKNLYLSECSSLVELPSSIGYITSLENLYLDDCSSLVKLPSSIGNITNLESLDLNECLSLVELPFSIGNITSLKKLYLSKCSSLVGLPSSIGNLHKLLTLRLQGCSKLEALPVNINMKSLNELDLTDCSLLKCFPEISTNIKYLRVGGTAIEQVPSSIKSWSRLHDLHMTYCESLGESPHVFDCITELHLTDARIQEIALWIKDMSRLHKLVVKGCTKLVSLPQLPDSIAFLDAENCESLERLDCSFHNTKFIDLNFVKCFNLNQEARDLIIRTPTCRFALLPGHKVPPNFTYRATGSSLSVKLNGDGMRFPTSLRFKACVLLVNKDNVEDGQWNVMEVFVRIEEKQNGVSVMCRPKNYHLLPALLRYMFTPRLNEHLYVFEFDNKVSSSELLFEFQVHNDKWEIGECGLLAPTVWVPRFDGS